MVRKAVNGLTEGEERIMRVLWSRKEASVREVADALAVDKPTAYNTALTMLKILHGKGAVSYRQDGRAFIYRAALSQEKARSNALNRLIGSLFGGSPAALAAHLVKDSELDSNTLDALRDELNLKRSDDETPS